MHSARHRQDRDKTSKTDTAKARDKPKGVWADSQSRATVIAALIVSVAGIFAAAVSASGQVISAEISKGPSPSPSSQPSATASGRGTIPQGKPGPSPSPSASPSAEPTTTLHPRPVRHAPTTGSRATLSAAASPSAVSSSTPTVRSTAKVNFEIGSVDVQSILGINLTHLTSLTWTSSVTLGGETLAKGCQVKWDLVDGASPLYEMTGPCDGTSTLTLPFLLTIGDYQLVGEADIGSGASVRHATTVQVGNG